MDLLHNYPVAFMVTVVLPVVSGIVLAIGGYDSLKARADSDRQLSRIEKNTDQALKLLPDINSILPTLARYEQTLEVAGKRDEALAAVLTQYKNMSRTSEAWDRMRSSTDYEQKYRLASDVLDLVGQNLIQVQTPENLPGRPLILGLGSNVFRVLFAVPMRIPPNLEFQGLPPGTQAVVTEKSEFGFTVMFSPPETPVSSFGFTASAEL